MSILISNSADAAHYLKQNQQQLQQSLNAYLPARKLLEVAKTQVVLR